MSVSAGGTGGVHWKSTGMRASGRPIVINMHRVGPDGKRVSLCSLQEYESEGYIEFLPAGVYAFDWIGSEAEYDAPRHYEAVVVEVKANHVSELMLADA